MKKILAVLLVLAVAGGVFAQEGSWSIGAQAEIGAYIDLIGEYTDADGAQKGALVHAAGYHTRDWWTPMTGQLELGYSNGGLGIDLTFSNFDWKFGGGVTYTGEAYKFQASADLWKLINVYTGLNDDGDDIVNNDPIGNASRLWGYYDWSMFHLEVAYNSRDNGDSFWVSDKTAVANPIQDPWDSGDSFTKSDHHNFLMGDFKFSGFSFGMYIPGLFTNGQLAANGWAYNPSTTYTNDRADWSGKLPNQVNTYTIWRRLVDDVLKQSVFGLKFEMSPFNVAAQLKLGTDTNGDTAYGVYFGGGWGSGPVNAGLSFYGKLATDKAGQEIKAGASAGYNPGAFGVGLKAFYGTKGDANENGGGESQIGVEPWFFYNVIPTHLQFKTDFGIYFKNDFAGAKESKVIYALQPQLFWNFLGTGAGGPNWWEAASTGMAFRYTMIRDRENSLEVYFRFKN